MKTPYRVSLSCVPGPWPPDNATATSLGSKYYFTGSLCRNGHYELRFTGNKKCLQCNRDRMQRLRAESEEYRAKEKQRSIDRLKYTEYREERCAEWSASRDRKREEDPSVREREREAARVLHETFKSDPAFKRMKAAIAREWYEENKEYASQRASAYYQDNRLKFLELARSNRAQRRGADGRFTRDDIDEIIKKQCGKCTYCNADITIVRHIDHIRPISRGGSNWPWNLQALCPRCNLSKGDRTHEEFLAYRVECESIAS